VNNSIINHNNYRRDIDGLRAIAVLSVIGFHAFGIRGGFVGVDIFFVISGFLISSILFTHLENNHFSFIEFYARRIKRIFPALILMLVTSFIIGWFILLPDEYKQLGKHIAGASLFVSNFLLWNEAGYFDNQAITKPLLHLWSLSIEEQFYIIWPFLLWIVWKKKFNLIYTISIIASISLFLNLKGIHSDSIGAFYSPQTRYWELLCGSFLASLTLFGVQKNFFTYYISKINETFFNNLLSILGFFLIIICLFALDRDSYSTGLFALLPTLGTFFIILATQDAWINRVILSNKTLVWFGLISFPLYLWHWPLLVFSKLSISGGVLSDRAAKILAVILSIILAWLTYKLIETPARFGKNSKTKTITLILLISIIGCIGYGAYYTNGLAFRVPKILQYANQTKYIPSYHVDSCLLENDRFHFGACAMASDKTKKTILLWGDSHAAHFYAGYKKRFGRDFNIVLISETGCRPIFSDKSSDEKCYKINHYILDLVKKTKPEKIVLSAAWGHHDDWMDVAKTIEQLKKLGIKNIDLIGPAPDWINTLPRQLFIYSRLNKRHQIPVRMSFGLDRHFLNLDVDMQALASREKVNYLSLAKVLCNDKGCITRVGHHFENLVSLDYGHFTEFGSIYIVSQLPILI
jgi:peptidoglycan/LPS O-acetylase OafA/YrhL